MRAVVQRVSEARVVVGERTVGEIEAGVVVLLGISTSDGGAEIAWIVDKVTNLRIFSDTEGKMNRSLVEVSGDVLVISQFTLYGDARKGRRPSFVRAARGPEAEQLYGDVVSAFKGAGIRCATGEFGAMMDVHLVNAGPVTILLDSAKAF
ncbi:MAG: D-aminoacyl-tRNA deacylase [Actinomycetota bacterium]|nr:D-aminoacyl-tRNA deacylase [Actinomycetota bacterium]